MPKTITENIIVKFWHLLEKCIQQWLIAGKTVSLDDIVGMLGSIAATYKNSVDFLSCLYQGKWLIIN